MRAVDDVVLALLEAGGVDIHDSDLELPPEGVTRKVIPYPLPYAVYYSSIGTDDRRRKSGRSARRSVFLSITYIGADRNQAKWCGEKIRALLVDQPIAVPGHNTWLCQLQESQRVRRDDEVMRPDGSPLFYGVDSYDIAITLPRTTP